MTGDKLYGVYLSEGDVGPYGPFCRDIELLWTKEEGLMEHGKVELLRLQEGEK